MHRHVQSLLPKINLCFLELSCGYFTRLRPDLGNRITVCDYEPIPYFGMYVKQILAGAALIMPSDTTETPADP